MDPETDLDAIARDLAEVEAELERLAEGTDGEDEDTSPRPADSQAGRAAVVAAGGIGIGILVAAGRRLGQLASWRSLRMWKMTARRHPLRRHQSPPARHPAERRAALDEQFAIRTAEDVAKELGEMKGVLMKVGQFVSFIVEALPDDAQAALSSAPGRRRPEVPSLAASVVREELGDEPERVFRSWDDLPVAAASIGQVHQDHDGRPRRRRQGAVPRRGRGDRGGPRRRRVDVHDALGDGVLNGLDARGLVDELRAGCARARLPPRSPQHRRVRPPLRRSPVGADPVRRPGGCRRPVF